MKKGVACRSCGAVYSENMNLDILRESQMEEIMQWAGELDTILTPDALMPARLKDFPNAMETSERLKRICKWKAAELKEEAQRIEDVELTVIENAEYLFKVNSGGMPTFKKTFNTADKRQRELRSRLTLNERYQQVKHEQFQWEMMYSDWVAHGNRLRREMRLLEMEYLQSGGDVYHRDIT